jgi:hypothetical protein
LEAYDKAKALFEHVFQSYEDNAPTPPPTPQPVPKLLGKQGSFLASIANMERPPTPVPVLTKSEFERFAILGEVGNTELALENPLLWWKVCAFQSLYTILSSISLLDLSPRVPNNCTHFSRLPCNSRCNCFCGTNVFKVSAYMHRPTFLSQGTDHYTSNVHERVASGWTDGLEGTMSVRFLFQPLFLFVKLVGSELSLSIVPQCLR